MKKHLLSSLFLLMLTTFTVTAGVTEFIPTSQTEFESNWIVDAPNDNGEWRWVDTDDFGGAPTLRWYRKVKSQEGAFIRTKNPISLKGKGYIYCSTSASDYDADTKYWLYISEDPTFATVSKKIVDGTNRFNAPKGSPVAVYSTHPGSESAAEFNFEEGKQYYIGLKAMGTGNYSGENFLLINSLTITQYDEVPGKTSSESVKLHNETANCYATFSWKWPTTTMLGTPITNIGAKIYRCPNEKPSNNGIINDQYLIKVLDIEERDTSVAFSYDDTPENSGDKAVTTPGKYYYAVIPYNENGDYNPGASTVNAVEAKWIGEDVSLLNPLSLAAQAVDGGIKLTYNYDEDRRKGYNGGYIDPEQVTMMITRQKAGDSEVKVLTKEWRDFESYTDNDLDGFAVYTYTISGLYKGDEENASSTQTVTVLGGGYLTLDQPYEQDFETDGSFGYFSVISSGISYKWKLSSMSTGNYAQFNGYGSTYSPCNSTLVSPPFMLEAGKTYRLTFDVWKGNSNSNPQAFQVRFGSDMNNLPESQNITLTSASANSPQVVEAFFTPETDGLAYFGLYANLTSSLTINVDNIRFEKSEVTPGPVTDLALDGTPTADNEFNATVTFKLPAVSKSGAVLGETDPAFTKVVLTRKSYGEKSNNANPETVDIEIEASDENALTPGKEMSFSDTVPARGFYSYSVKVCMDNDTESDAVTTSTLWVGYDTPRGILTFSNSMNAEKNAVNFTMTPYSSTSLAQNNGYIDTENLLYEIYLDGVEEPVYSGTENTFSYPLINDDPWQIYNFTAYISNHGYKSNASTAKGYVGGNVIEEDRINPDFTDDSSIDLWDQTAGWGTYQGVLRGYRTIDEKNAIYLPPFELTDASKLGCTIDLTMYRDSDSDPDYVENGELLSIYLYDLNLEEGQEPIECVATRGKSAFPPVAEQTLVAQAKVLETKDDPGLYTYEVIAPKPGKYRFGFSLRKEGVEALYISALDIRLGATETVKTPEAVTDFTAVADPEGANTVSLEFTLPEATTGGAILKQLTKAEVLRAQGEDEQPEYRVVRTIENEECTPGQTVVLTDNVDEAGYYAYRVIAYLDEEGSEPVDVEKQWVGFDVPATPEVQAESSASQVVITWEMPEALGIHGGYVNAANLNYKVFRSDKEAAIATVVGEKTYTDKSVATCPWDLYTYSVAAVNGLTAGEEGYAEAVQAGDVIEETTVEPDFSDETSLDLWTLSGGWSTSEGCLYAVNATGDDEAAYLPPVRVTDANQLGCALTLNMYREETAEDYVETLKVYACKVEETQGGDDTPGRGKPVLKNVALPETAVAEFNVTSAQSNEYTAAFNLPETGKYRLALRCESDDNKGLYISALKFETNKETDGVSAVVFGNGLALYGNKLTLPEGASYAEVYTVAGVKVGETRDGALDISNLVGGVYIVRVVMNDGTSTSTKLVK